MPEANGMSGAYWSQDAGRDVSLRVEGKGVV